MGSTEICQICKAAPAAVNITQVIKGKKQEWHLCEACAEEKGGVNSLSGLPDFFENVIANLFGAEKSKGTEPRESENVECPSCHMSLEDIEKDGLLGCAKCYETFRVDLELLLRRIHGSTKHIGSRPRPQRVFGKSPDLQELRNELLRAVEQEDYEKAAEYRDLIRNLEREVMNHPGRAQKTSREKS